MILPSGRVLGRYRIEGVLGQGQTGIVYRAFDTAIERTVAVKCLRPDNTEGEPAPEDQRISVLFDEAKAIGRLNHPHITAIYDVGSFDDVLCIVMEFVEGQTLKAKLAELPENRASGPQILSFIVMVARALHYVHQRGILHGDIKPANLIVTPHGTPKIMDFGVARRSASNKASSFSLAGQESVCGTPGYMAPEQLTEDEIDARADVFSLGVIAYEWLAGRKPFSGATVEQTLQAVLEAKLTPLSELGNFDPELSALISQALARDRRQRFSSADALADALEVCQEKWLKPVLKPDEAETLESRRTEKFPRLRGRNILFADFTEEELSRVMKMSRQEHYREGQVIVQEGAGGSTMYVVARGLVSVRRSSGTQDIEIKQIARGGCFGEMAVISQLPRSATVVALEPTEVIAISGAVLRSSSPTMCMKLYRNIASLLSDRLRHLDDQVVSLMGTDRTSHFMKEPKTQ